MGLQREHLESRIVVSRRRPPAESLVRLCDGLQRVNGAFSGEEAGRYGSGVCVWRRAYGLRLTALRGRVLAERLH